MAVYQYQAIASPHTLQRGTVCADSPRSARDLLRARGLQIQTIRTVATRKRSWWRSWRGAERHKLLSFLREMATLLSVGVPLNEALDQIARQHRGGFKSLLLSLRERIAAGQSFSEALKESPHVFDDLCIAIVQAGEDAGTLDRCLSRLAQFKERSHQLGAKLTTTLIYPCIVLILAVAIAVFLMTYVVPSILQPLQELGRPLPAPTRVVQAMSGFLVSWGWLCAIGVAITAIGVAMALRVKRVRSMADRTLMNIPVLGELIRKTLIVRIAVVISTLLGSGVVFLHALRIAAATTRNSVINDALKRCESAVTAGSDIARALENTHAFPPVVVQVFSVGEQSGQLAEMLEKLAQDYDQEVATTAQRLTALLEPILIISLAAVVLLIAMATMLPIMEVGNAME